MKPIEASFSLFCFQLWRCFHFDAKYKRDVNSFSFQFLAGFFSSLYFGEGCRSVDSVHPF